MKIGVLALQGAFREHRQVLHSCGAETVEVRRQEHLPGLAGVIIPGGESTTIGKLLVEWDLMRPLREAGEQGLPIFGTCAGMVLLAKDIKGSDQPRLGLLDICVVRNAYGRQVDSFETDLTIKGLEGGPYHAVFIRAPYLAGAGAGVEVLAEHGGQAVMARQGNLLACSFHPELTRDSRVHRMFLEMAAGYLPDER